MKLLRHLAFTLLILCSSAAFAQLSSLTDGAVYHFQNVGNTGIALGATALSDVAGLASDKDNKTQQWYVKKSGDDYTFRNLANGCYLKGAGKSTSWGLSTDASADANLFELASKDGNNTLRCEPYKGGYGYMHKDGSNNIVGWEPAATATQWTITTIEYEDDELNAIWDEIAALIPDEETVSSYKSALDAIFADDACTKLNSPYVSMEVESIKTDANYLKLPAELQAMVLKVRSGDWTEANAASGKSSWSDEYARKFRVQMYEPYSIEGEITSYLRFNAHCNMDNPTGLYANNGQPMYIMVEGDIAEGAELWVAHQTGHGATAKYDNIAYTQLKEGLNVVPYFSDGSQLWINYVVHTYNSAGATIQEKFPHKISDYKPLKIHIEGGYINGYYNAIGDFRAADSETNLWGDVDNDEDWKYYKERAPLNGTDAPNRDFPLLGHRQTLLFEFGDIIDEGDSTQKGISYWLDAVVSHKESNTPFVATPDKPYNNSGLFSDYTNMGLDASTGRINIMIEAWDRIMYSELATMGLVSTSTMDKMNKMYPRWTAEGKKAEIYNYGKSAADQQTYIDFCQGIDYSEYFNHHGTGQGAYSGYMSGGWRVCNYHYNTMGSVIGKIANEAGPTWGPAHEIGHQHQATFNLNGQTEVTNNFFSNVAVWYMGMGTSRYNGSEGNLQHVLEAFNKEGNDAYTNNIWALTHIYYRLWLYYHLAGNNTQFWPRLYELCRRVPLVNGGQISGETSLLRFYQHACDAAGEDLTEFFRAHGYLEVMDNRLVGDYSNAYYNQTQEQIDAAIAAVKAKNYPENLAVLFINDGTSNTGVRHDGVTARSLWDGSPSADYGSVTDFIKGDVSVSTNYTASVDANGNVTMSGGSGGIGFVVLNTDGEIVSFSNKSEFVLSEEAIYLVATGGATISSIDDASSTTSAEIDLSALQQGLLGELIGKAQAIINLADNTNTKVGFYKPTSIADLVAACDAAKEQLSTGVALGAAYEKLYTEYKNVQNDEYAVIKIMPGSTYAIQNKTGKDYMSVNIADNKIITNSTAPANEAKNRWVFEQGSTSGTYKIKNVSTGTYLQAVTDYNSVDFTVGNAAVDYIVSEVGSGYLALSTAAVPERYMDRHNANQVATWGAKSDNASWYITLVEENKEIVNTDKLSELIDKTEALIGKMAVLDPLKTNLPLQVTNSSNPYYISCSNLDSSEGSDMNYLIDNNINTYIHSNYHNISASNDWLDVDLGSGNKLSMFAFSEVTRSNVYNDFPKTIDIYGSNTKSNDISDYTPIATVTGLPNDGGQTWESDAVIAAEDYRYLRFVVTTWTGNKFFHMAEFDLYSIDYDVTKLEGFSSVNDNLVKEAYKNMLKGKAWLTRNDATAANITDAEENLQDAYEALKTAYNNALEGLLAAEKEPLQELIDQTNELISEVGAAVYSLESNVYLHGKLYCNSVYTAGGTNHSDYTSAENDYKLLDGNTGTHYHSDYNYSTMVSDPYIRVDLGEKNKVSKFRFNYTTRNQAGCAPKAISVYGGNYDDLTGDVSYTDTPVAQFTLSENALPTATKTFWESNDITADQAYRYYKFVVTESEGAKTENGVKKYYFAISEFGFTKCAIRDVTINDKFTNYVSEELLLNTRAVVNDSENLMENATTVEQLRSQYANLQKAYEKLLEAADGCLPFVLTTDESNPVLYKIFIKRTADVTVLQYDEATKQVAVSDKADNSSYQAWYFTGTSSNFSIHPYNADGKVLSADNTANAPAKVWAADKGEKSYYQWKLVERADGYYNIQAIDGSNYFSNNGGTDNKMGFWSGSPESDGGSLFKFVDAEFDNDNPRFYQLSDYKKANIDGRNLYEGEAVGFYTVTEKYRQACSDASAIITAGSTSNATVCYNVYKALRSANSEIFNLPKEEKFYTLRSHYKSNHYIFANNQNTVRYGNGYSSNVGNSRYIWQFSSNNDGKIAMMNLHTGSYSGQIPQDIITLSATEAFDVNILPYASIEGAIEIKSGDNYYHINNGDGADQKVIGWVKGAGGNPIYIEEVAPEYINYSVTIGSVGWSTLCLNYAVEVPEGVTAYAALGVDGNSVVLQSVGNVIPAGTAVLLNLKEGAATGNYSFKYTSQSVEPQSLSENKLVGTYYDSYIEADKENVKYYMLAKIDDTKAGMKQIYREYSYDDNGTLVSHKNTDDGTHFKNNANKVYLPVPKENGANEVKAYSLRIIDGTTGVDEVVGNIGVAPEGIYDLSGRRIIEITEPGIYIVNGKKFIKK
ncbi:MAG: M60 family metallopeptidase [Bacteroidaceae bacterium]|nr:M60 family metallopeptidase [Bacteroidaceae bacterium]